MTPTTDRITFHEAYNILLGAVHEDSSAAHKDDEHELSRSHTQALADRENRLHESVLALLDVLAPSCSDRIYAIEDVDVIEFITDTLDDVADHLKADQIEPFTAVIEARIEAAEKAAHRCVAHYCAGNCGRMTCP